MSFRLGAFDYVLKPPDLKELAAVTEKIAEKQAKIDSHTALNDTNKPYATGNSVPQGKKKISDKSLYDTIPGISKFGVFSKNLKSAVTQVLQFHDDRTIPVIIEGETGTGKEIIARLIHYGVECDTRPFITVNCAAIPEELFESELFGYEGG